MYIFLTLCTKGKILKLFFSYVPLLPLSAVRHGLGQAPPQLGQDSSVCNKVPEYS